MLVFRVAFVLQDVFAQVPNRVGSMTLSTKGEILSVSRLLGEESAHVECDARFLDAAWAADLRVDFCVFFFLGGIFVNSFVFVVFFLGIG